MKKPPSNWLCCLLLWLVPLAAHAQVNSGSNGSDGAFNPTTNTVINMADHLTGIYQYTSVNIPSGVTVTFIPNVNNTPVVWLVQSNVFIGGTVDVSGKTATAGAGAVGGPGGWKGGSAGNPVSSPGQGPGGGNAGNGLGGQTGGSFATLATGAVPSALYGNIFLLPLLGGSGGGGWYFNQFGVDYFHGGGGGGGAILVAASGFVTLNGYIVATGGLDASGGGGGSGGSIRIVTPSFSGAGSMNASGASSAGAGRIRIDALEDVFAGSYNGGSVTKGFQPIIIPTAGQGAQLTVTSIGGVPVSASPTGQLSTPDAVLSAQQNNPIPIVVHCSNIPLNTQITVSVKPVNGATVSATGLNNTGTLSSSTATVLIAMPRGGGLIYATAATGN